MESISSFILCCFVVSCWHKEKSKELHHCIYYIVYLYIVKMFRIKKKMRALTQFGGFQTHQESLWDHRHPIWGLAGYRSWDNPYTYQKHAPALYSMHSDTWGLHPLLMCPFNMIEWMVAILGQISISIITLIFDMVSGISHQMVVKWLFSIRLGQFCSVFLQIG